jgi:hypothetical protein
MEAHFELKWARRPANELRRLIGEKHMGDEAERQTNDADTQHQGIEQQDVNDAERRSRHLAERKVQQGKHDHQDRDSQGDHFTPLISLSL